MIFGLMRKHAELLASIRETSIALLGQQSALAAIKRALRVFDPTIARATEHQRRGDQVEGLYRFILDQLRQKARVTTLGAARELIEARRLDADNRTLLTALRKRIGDALHNMREQGCVYGEWYGAGGELE
jgi:hypothetical protein